MSNAERGKLDPPHATLVHVHCERCGVGDKETAETFFTARGREISFEEIDRWIKKQQAAAHP